MTIEKPAYSLEIDEEGYPILSGLRIDDEDFNREIFANVKRIDPSDPLSALVTTSGQKPVLLYPFAAPFVAQSVSEITATDSIWHFLGGLTFCVPHDKLRIDVFNRVHAPVFAGAFPALLSRKAHSEFLLNDLAPTEIRPFFEPVATSPVGDKKFWQTAYAQPKQGWELGDASPVLIAGLEAVATFAKASSGAGQVLVPGAGRAHDAEKLTQIFSQVTAVDFAPEAKAEHDKLYPKSAIDYLVDDVFTHLAKRPSFYDAIFEHTCLCAIDPGQRSRYFTDVAQALKPKGLYFGIFWMRLHPGGPPFGLDAWELRERALSGFDILAWDVSKDSIDSRYGQELWAVFRRK